MGWATPYGTQWNSCIIRTDSGVATGTFTIHGRSDNSDPGPLLTGIGWDQARTNPWATAEVTYYTGR